MKAFNLEKALAGEPVKLRDGSKAYVKFVMPNEYKGSYPLVGYYIKGDSYIQYTWMINGRARVTHELINEDIESMWEEPRPRVTLTLPAPLKAPQKGMWYIQNGMSYPSTYNDEEDEYFNVNLFKCGFYFTTKEDAEEWLKAMRGARR